MTYENRTEVESRFLTISNINKENDNSVEDRIKEKFCILFM